MPGAARREAVHCLVARGLSQRRAWARRQLPRSTLGSPARLDGHAGLAAQVDALARRHPRAGYRRVWALRRRHGQAVHKKRGPRRWQRATWPVRQVTRQWRPTRRAIIPGQATHPGQVWPYALRHEHCLNGMPWKVLTVLDAFTRAGRALEGATSLPAQRVRAALERLVALHGAPQCRRSAHGPECIAVAGRGWLARHRMATLYMAPGRPWEQAYGARFHGTGRDDCLHRHVCHSVADARLGRATYRRQYQAQRPHRSVSDRTPAEVKQEWHDRPLSSLGLEHFSWPRLLGACQGDLGGIRHIDVHSISTKESIVTYHQRYVSSGGSVTTAIRNQIDCRAKRGRTSAAIVLNPDGSRYSEISYTLDETPFESLEKDSAMRLLSSVLCTEDAPAKRDLVVERLRGLRSDR